MGLDGVGAVCSAELDGDGVGALSDRGIPLYKTWNTNGLLYNESRLADSLTTKTICSTG